MILLIDANSIAHQAKHSLKGLSYHEMKVGVIFGFMKQILSLAKTFNTNQFIFTWDSQESLRKKIYPTYKEKRRKNKTEEDLRLDELSYPQFDALRKEVLPQIGFANNWMQKGYEADDLLAMAILEHSHIQEKFVIVSTDEDLYQLLSDNVSMYSIRKKQTYTAKNLYKDYGVTPEQWVMVKAIGGCSTDEVVGIKGVGEKTAAKYLTGNLNVNTKTYQSIKKGTDIIERNIPLVRLPFEDVEFTDYKRSKLVLDQFVKVCDKYGFQSFLSRDTFIEWRNYVLEKN